MPEGDLSQHPSVRILLASVSVGTKPWSTTRVEQKCVFTGYWQDVWDLQTNIISQSHSEAGKRNEWNRNWRFYMLLRFYELVPGNLERRLHDFKEEKSCPRVMRQQNIVLYQLFWFWNFWAGHLWNAKEGSMWEILQSVDQHYESSKWAWFYKDRVETWLLDTVIDMVCSLGRTFWLWQISLLNIALIEYSCVRLTWACLHDWRFRHTSEK